MFDNFWSNEDNSMDNCFVVFRGFRGGGRRRAVAPPFGGKDDCSFDLLVWDFLGIRKNEGVFGFGFGFGDGNDDDGNDDDGNDDDDDDDDFDDDETFFSFLWNGHPALLDTGALGLLFLWNGQPLFDASTVKSIAPSKNSKISFMCLTCIFCSTMQIVVRFVLCSFVLCFPPSTG